MIARKRWIVLAALAVIGMAVAPAGAATFCVSDPACVLAGGTSEPDLQSALTAAAAALGPDTVKLGPGRFSAANGFLARDANAAIAVVGAGRGQTTLTATTAGRVVLDFGASRDATVSDLSVTMPPSGGVGVFVPQHIARVTIAGGTGGATGLWTQNTSVDDVTIQLPLDGSSNTGVYRPNGDLRADDLTVVAHDAINGFGGTDAYKHLRVVSDGTGVSLTSSLSNTMTIDDAQIRMSGAGVGLVFSAQSGTPAFLQARFLTVQGDGTSNSVGVASQGGVGGTVANVTLEDSVVAGFDHALSCDPGSGQARFTARWSAFDPSDLVQRCATAIDTRTGNIASDPQLVPAANGDLLPAEVSPAVDAGDPALTAPVPATDLAGNARLVDGNRDGTARVDMGAFEYVPPVVPPPPGVRLRPPLVRLALTHFRIVPASFAPVPRARRRVRRAASRGPHHGATFRFRLSREAAVTIRVSVLRSARRGRRLVAVLRRTLRGASRAGDGRLRFDGRDGRGHALAPGRYRAAIVARAGAAMATARSISFTILAP